MNLYEALEEAHSEEDVKDAYIKALGLKGYSKGLIDIQTKEIWFEAKDNNRNSTYAMFTQLMHYVQVALNQGEYIPPFLAVIDTSKAALMKSSDVIPFLAKKTIKWGKSASQYTQEALDEISTHIGTHFVSFKIETHEREFINTVKQAIKSGEIIRINITPDNLKQVFDKWVAMIGREISGVTEDDYALLFYADIMHDGTVSTHANLPAELLHKNNAPVFSLRGHIYELGNKEGYLQFWAIYHKPPESEYRDYLLERRDSLIPLDERSFKGAYYTPLAVVDKVYDTLTSTLGNNWQKKYLVWDMCCGVGNLETKHSNHRKIFMSTLDVADVNVMMATKTCVSAQRFQYDYLNDDITPSGEIDYSITNKIPEELRNAISNKKKILVLINPPYAEATSADNVNKGGGDSKTGVAKTKVAATMGNYGYATRELFAQFLVRIKKEIPGAVVATFSTLKYFNSGNFESFRDQWKAKYLGGFIVHSKAFDGLNGNFPIGFLIWDTSTTRKLKETAEISVAVLDKSAKEIGEKKFYNLPSNSYLSNWLPRLKTDCKNIPLKNAIEPQIGKAKVTSWFSDSIGYFWCNGNDFQQSGQQTAILSSVFSAGNGYYITKDNVDKVAVMFSVRQLIKHTWQNHNDQFIIPAISLPEEFKTDCLIWMLFHGKNLSAGANLQWNNREWHVVNHFIPFTESDVSASERFESDFMIQYLKTKQKSVDAQSVLNEGKLIWKQYFQETDVHTVREAFKLNRSDVGWYQIRNALKARNNNSNAKIVDFKNFEIAYGLLSSKLMPQVFELGFLR